jgi:hypothetical protein
VDVAELFGSHVAEWRAADLKSKDCFLPRLGCAIASVDLGITQSSKERCSAVPASQSRTANAEAYRSISTRVTRG